MDEETAPLTPDELARLRKILQQDEHMAWFWATARHLAMWLFGATAVLVAFRDDVRSLFSWFVKGP